MYINSRENISVKCAYAKAVVHTCGACIPGVHVYICIYMHMYIYIHIKYLYIDIYIQIYTYRYTFSYVAIYMYLYIHMYVCIYVYTHIHIYLKIYTHHNHTCIHIYVYIAATLRKISCCCLSEESPAHICKVHVPATVFSCHVAVCSSMLQRVAMCCSAWQNSPNAYWTCELQHVAACCSVLQCVVMRGTRALMHTGKRASALVNCSTLQHVAACCSVWQCVEPECIPANVPPRLWNSMAVSSRWVESRECTKFGGNADRCLPLLIGSVFCEWLRRTCCKTVFFILRFGV